MTNIVVTGAAGQLGTAMRTGIRAATFLTHDQLDLGEPDGMRAVLDELTPEILINCAAYTAVDRAQEQESIATRINGTAVAEMAEYCQVSGARFVDLFNRLRLRWGFRRPLARIRPDQSDQRLWALEAGR